MSAQHPKPTRDALHQPSGRWLFGLGLTLTTAGLWAMLPIALKILLDRIDPFTTTWIRFSLSAILLLTALRLRSSLPDLRSLGPQHWKLLALATCALAGNYVGYVMGLERTNPGTSQVVIQVAPVLLTMGGIVIFNETFSKLQWAGVATLVAGLTLFSYDRVNANSDDPARFALGVAILLAAGTSWAVYGLAQKQLLARLSSPSVMVCIYAGCALLVAPLASPSSILQLDSIGWMSLGFSVANMLVAYAAFSEALAHWQASRVSAVLACVPLLTLGVVAVASQVMPTLIAPESLSTLSIGGASLVVVGSLTAALGKG